MHLARNECFKTLSQIVSELLTNFFLNKQMATFVMNEWKCVNANNYFIQCVDYHSKAYFLLGSPLIKYDMHTNRRVYLFYLVCCI